MVAAWSLPLLLFWSLIGTPVTANACLDIPTISVPLSEVYCRLQPLFLNFLPKTEATALLDNICYTYFPLPDPDTYTLYQSSVFCDGSYQIETYVITDLNPRTKRAGSPYCTYTTYVVDYAPCDTYVLYRCTDFGRCADDLAQMVFGLSPSCRPLGLSCLSSVQRIMDDAGLPDQDLLVLPMKLPNRCVTERLCVNHAQGDFYDAVGVASRPPPLPLPTLIL